MMFESDFHIHTCLSPCADITMVPCGGFCFDKIENCLGINSSQQLWKYRGL